MTEPLEKTIHESVVGNGSSRLPESFFARTGTGSAKDYFDDSVRATLDAYADNPQQFSAVEELLIIDKYYLAILFSSPGILDVDGMYKIYDKHFSIKKNPKFPYKTELGKRFMAYISELVEYAQYESTYNGTLYFENTTLYNPSSAKYESRDAWSAEAGFSDFNFSSAYNTPVTKEDAMLIRLEEKPLFQSFIARELGYTKNDFGRSFPIDLFTNFLINQSPDRFEDVTRISKQALAQCSLKLFWPRNLAMTSVVH